MIERKYLAHFIDANMRSDYNGSYPTGTNYVRIGKHLEAFAEEMNPQIEQHKNILGDTVVIHSGYEPSGSVDKYYAEVGDPLYERLEEIVLERLSGDDCKTTFLDVMFEVGSETNIRLTDQVNALWAYKEDCYIVVQSYGGDTSGVQIPFQIVKAGNRVKVSVAKSGNTLVITGLG